MMNKTKTSKKTNDQGVKEIKIEKIFAGKKTTKLLGPPDCACPTPPILLQREDRA